MNLISNLHLTGKLFLVFELVFKSYDERPKFMIFMHLKIDVYGNKM